MKSIEDGATTMDMPSAEPATTTVLTQVRELIVTGTIGPGARLAAEAIAKDLGVSRTPVRSALAVLTAEGLVSHSMNRGYTVRDIGFRDILDAVEARAVLEARACGLSVDYGWSEEELGALEADVDSGRAIIAGGRWSEEIEHAWYEANRGFHSLIVRASRNATMRNAVRMTLIHPIFGDIARTSPAVSKFVPKRFREIPAEPPEHIVDSQADHEAILAAIRDDDAVLAEKLMLDHVLKGKARLAACATRR
ncbi:GntR family transcriptional regulator [Alteriqipengyuania lutimaris]|nr:GntR family transcriptional regulator [Alteriqipengyuania lutimaris]MBB3034709.1 GntR family transcriptional regulator of vanillate catabolism [Alteriqipengyuania lutimaris]